MQSAKFKPRILILTDWYLPGFRAGGPIRSVANLVEWLEDKAEFIIITSDRDKGSEQIYPEIRANEWTIGKHKEKIFYASPSWLTYSNLKKLLSGIEFDFILMNSMFSNPFTIWPLRMFALKKNNFRILLAPRGMLAKGALSIKPLKKKLFLNFFRFLGIPKKIFFLATGSEEVDDIKREFGENARYLFAPNLPSKNPEIPVPLHKEKNKAVFISIARFAEVKNNLFTIKLFTTIDGESRLDLYGPISEPMYFKKCLEAMETAGVNSTITYHGELNPEDVRKALSHAHFFIMNSLSENFGHAIIEALNEGKPVIISKGTPWRNLEESHAGWDIALENEKKYHEIIHHCIEMDNEEYSKWSAGASAKAIEFLSSGDVVKKNEAIFGI